MTTQNASAVSGKTAEASGMNENDYTQDSNFSPPKQAASDLLLSRPKVVAIVNGASTVWDEIDETNLVPPPGEQQPYPIDAMGSELGALAELLSRVIDIPYSMSAHGLVAAVNFTTQPFADVEIDGRVYPISEDFMTIAESGERKSELDRKVLMPHKLVQEDLERQHEEESEAYSFNKETFEACKQSIMKGKSDLHAKREALTNLGKAPQELLEPYLLIEEPTYVGMVKLFEKGQASMGLFSGEGGQFIGGYSMGEEHKIATAAGMSKFWDGDPVDRHRGGDEGSRKLRGRRLAVHLMLQPAVAPKFLNDPVLRGQGITNRFLISQPASTVKTYVESDITAHKIYSDYCLKVTELLRLPQPLAPGKLNELKPPRLKLSASAKQAFILFHNEVERHKLTTFKSVRGLASKAAEHALRLAGTLSLWENVETRVIELRHVKSGIALLRWYLHEGVRLNDVSMPSRTDRDADELADWLRDNGSECISMAEIQQTGPNRLRAASTIRSLMSKMIDAGIVIRGSMPVQYDGKLRKECWLVRPRI